MLKEFIRLRKLYPYCLLILLFLTIFLGIILIKPRVRILSVKKGEFSTLREQIYLHKSQSSGNSPTNKFIIEKIPIPNPLSEFIVDVEKIAEKNDLNIQNLYSEKEFEDGVKIIPTKIKLKGYYSSLVKFIEEIEEYPKLVGINSVELKTLSTEIFPQDIDYDKGLWELVVAIDLYYLPRNSVSKTMDK